jgi:drug/metabolite transporter (DMT)-like permease
VVLLVTPLVGVVWLLAGRPGLPPAGWGLAVVSGLFELAYFIFLSEGYRRGDLSVVYPIARGTAPVLAVLAGLFLLREYVTIPQLLGVFCLLAGIWAVRRPRSAGPATSWALLTAVCIATYTTVDRLGVRLGPPWLYGWAVFFTTCVFLLTWLTVKTRRFELPTDWPSTLGVGLLMTTTYVLILYALSIAPLAVIAPLRESSIVLVALWGVFRMGERDGWPLKLAGALATLAGAALVTL